MAAPYSEAQARLLVGLATAFEWNADDPTFMPAQSWEPARAWGPALRGLWRRRVPLVDRWCDCARLTAAGWAEAQSLRAQGYRT